MWLGFPSHGDIWLDHYEAAQAEVAALALALAGPGAERVRLMVCGDEAEATARMLIGTAPGIELVRAQFGDVWLRDTGPIFLKKGEAELAEGFVFNGWGGKYDFPGDELVADQIAAANVPVLLNPISNLPGSLETRAARMQNAAVLDAAGVVIAIKGNEGSVHRAREARYNAGNAVSHGLPFEAAIAALTRSIT